MIYHRMLFEEESWG